MAGKHSAGCLGTAFAAITLLTAVTVGPALFSAPAFVGYFLIADPARLDREAAEWPVTMAATALLAAALVAVTGRGTPTVLRVLRRTVLLLLATTATSLAALVFEVRQGSAPTLQLSATPVFAAAAIALLALGYWRLRDDMAARRTPERVEGVGARWPGERLESSRRRPRNRPGNATRPKSRPVKPATVEQVRQVTEQAKQSLHRARAENDRLERLLRELEAKLANAQSELSFAGLRQLHGESWRCADGVYQHYKATDRLLSTISRTHSGVRLALESTNGQGRPNRQAYATATSEMSSTEGRLRAEVKRGRSMLDTLNQRTEALKYRIRDDCGTPGQQWYDDLIARRDARVAERAAQT